MLKAAGAVLVMAASLYIGFGRRQALADRVNRLCLVRWEASSLRSKIYTGGESLEQIFAESSFFAPAAELIAKGIPADKAVMSLNAGIGGFELFAKGLTRETAEAQLQNTDIFLNELEGEILRAREELDKKGRLCVGGGFLAGAAIVLILL